MIKISLCMIVKNEENSLEKCLNSVKSIVDEIIIVDTGSTDKTKEKAKKYTSLIYDFEWIDDFSAARNYAFSKATKDYILWLDADDIILPEDRKAFLKLKKTLDPAVDIVMMRYNTAFDQNGNVVFSYFRERLSKRSRGFLWKEPVHEHLSFYGNIIHSEIPITHNKTEFHSSDRNLKIYEKLLLQGKELSPRGTYYYARELKDHGRLEDAIIFYEGFLSSKKGWKEDVITACKDVATCYLTLNRREEAFLSLVRSFRYDLPRAEICCQLGYYFKDENVDLAIYWFKEALRATKPENSWGFIQHDCYGYIPAIELAVCYDRLKEYSLAEHFNDLAGTYKPESKAFLFNQEYFKQYHQKS